MEAEIRYHYEKRRESYLLDLELRTHTTEMTNLWSQAARIVACTTQVPEANRNIIDYERQIIQLEQTCISSYRK